MKTRLGDMRSKLTYAYRSIMENGITLAGASDAPIENPSVLNAIAISMHRFNFVPEENLTIKQALRMFTINAAKALRQDKIKGSLEAGKFADFILLNRNPLDTPVEEIKNIKVLETYRRGVCIYKEK